MNPRKTLTGLVALTAAALSLTFAGAASAATLPACSSADLSAIAGQVQTQLTALDGAAATYAGGAYNYTYATYTSASSLSPLSSLTTADQSKDLGLLNEAITAVANALNTAQNTQGCLISGGTTVAPTNTAAAPTTTVAPAPAAEVPEASVASTGTPGCISAIGGVSARWAAYDVAFRSSNAAVTDDYVAYQRALNEAQATCVGSPVITVSPAPASGTTTSVTTATIPSASTGVQTGDGSAPSE